MDNIHKKLILKDADGNKYQIMPETDVNSVIGLKRQMKNMQDQIDDVNRALGRTNNRVLYH